MSTYEFRHAIVDKRMKLIFMQTKVTPHYRQLSCVRIMNVLHIVQCHYSLVLVSTGHMKFLFTYNESNITLSFIIFSLTFASFWNYYIFTYTYR